ncbi:MAG TPA: hypothetical protein VF155_11370 [Candidatus Dormibacteraeota bacterium]
MPTVAWDAVFGVIGEWASIPLVRDIGPLVALAIPTLPAVGTLVRAAALSTLGVNGRFAAASPLGDLVLTGANVFLYPVYSQVLLVAGAPILRGWLTGHSPRIRLIIRIAIVVAVVAFLLLAPPWPLSWFVQLPQLLEVILLYATMRGGRFMSIRTAATTVLFAGLVAAAVSGLTLSVPDVVAVRATFTAGVPLATGKYILLGQDAGNVYLTPCSHPGAAYQLPTAQVTSLVETTAPAAYGGSLVGVVFQGKAGPQATAVLC